MLEYFKRLEIDMMFSKNIIPTWRQDLLSYADIAEEVARFFGYDKIPTTLPSGQATAGRLSYKLVGKLARELQNSADSLRYDLLIRSKRYLISLC